MSALCDPVPDHRAVPNAEHAADQVLARLPRGVRDSFDAAQEDAIRRAVAQHWRQHPVNIRVSLPVARRRFYLTVLGGPERRSRARRRSDRRHHRLRTVSNILFIAAGATAVYAGALLTLVGLHALL